jgi:hypothetical protein
MMIFYIFLGSLLCYFFKSKKYLSPVKTSTLLTLICSIFVNDPLELALIYGGSFLGMSQPLKSPFSFFVLGSGIYFLLIYLLEPLEWGFGGTLGTIAFVSSGMTTLIFKAINPSYEQ